MKDAEMGGSGTYRTSDLYIAVGTIYIQKEMLGDPPPRRLRVIIEAEE